MSTLPEKWAVEITSLQDAERLQALFPFSECNFDSFKDAFDAGFRYFKCDIVLSPETWFWLDTNPSRQYTRLTIDELENLLK